MKKIFPALGAIASLVGIATFFIVYVLPVLSTNNLNEIRGEWDSSEALLIVQNEINKNKDLIYKDICPKERCKLKHAYTNEFPLIFPDKEIVLVIATSSKEDIFPCHNCGVSAHLFEFKKVKDHWILSNSDFLALTGGSWGELNSDIEAKVIGNNIYGLFIRHGYVAFGSMDETLQIFAKIKDDYKLIFHINKGHSMSLDRKKDGIYEDDWDSNLQIIKHNSPGFFDFLIKTKGTVNKKKVSDSVLLNFDSYAYRGDKIPYYLIADCFQEPGNYYRFEDVDAIINSNLCD